MMTNDDEDGRDNSEYDEEDDGEYGSDKYTGGEEAEGITGKSKKKKKFKKGKGSNYIDKRLIIKGPASNKWAQEEKDMFLVHLRSFGGLGSYSNIHSDENTCSDSELLPELQIQTGFTGHFATTRKRSCEEEEKGGEGSQERRAQIQGYLE